MLDADLDNVIIYDINSAYPSVISELPREEKIAEKYVSPDAAQVRMEEARFIYLEEGQ